MARVDSFHCSVITPERKLLEVDARFVAFPAHDGEMGVLPLRAPLVCKLGIGPLRVETADRKYEFFVDEGFAQMIRNRFTVLTEQACEADQLDRTAARKELEQARTMPVTDDASLARRAKAEARARVQLRMTASHPSA